MARSTSDIRHTDYLAPAHAPPGLATRPTRVEPFYKSKNLYQKKLRQYVEALSRQQEMLYASGDQALLLIFQAMDAAGKDSTIKAVLSGVNPQGCRVHSFKPPDDEEKRHDFLWRAMPKLPMLGTIGVFNRSYYEEVLIVRVHPEQMLAPRYAGADLAALWSERHRAIAGLEAHLARNGTRIVKFFLHVSPDTQRKRLLERLDDPEKHWKFDPADLRERMRWDDYMRAYEDCLQATSTPESPWYVIPADDKENMRLIVARIVLDTLLDMGLSFPSASPALLADMPRLRQELADG